MSCDDCCAVSPDGTLVCTKLRDHAGDSPHSWEEITPGIELKRAFPPFFDPYAQVAVSRYLPGGPRHLTEPLAKEIRNVYVQADNDLFWLADHGHLDTAAGVLGAMREALGGGRPDTTT